MKPIFLISFFFAISILCAQSMDFKNSISGELGARVYDTDLGLGTGFDAGLTFMAFNTSSNHSPFVFSIRSYFNNLHAEDKAGTLASREFLGFSGGIGLHLNEKIFAIINIGYLFLLNSNTDPADLESAGATYASIKGAYVFNPLEDSKLSFFINSELGYTFSDIEALDRGKADKIEGSTFLFYHRRDYQILLKPHS